MKSRSCFASRWLKLSKQGRRLKPSVLVVVVVALCASVLVPLAADPPLFEQESAAAHHCDQYAGDWKAVCELVHACTNSGGTVTGGRCVYPTTTTTTTTTAPTTTYGPTRLTCSDNPKTELLCRTATTTTTAPPTTTQAPTTTSRPVGPVTATCHRHGSHFVNNECHTHPTNKACGETVWVHTGDLSNLHTTHKVTATPPCAPPPCPTGQHRVNGACVSRCKAAEKWVTGPHGYGACVPRCVASEKWVNGACVPRCKAAEKWVTGPHGYGACVPRCVASEKWVNGACVPRCTAAEKWVTGPHGYGACVPRCVASEKWVNGACVSRCTADERWVNGSCVSRCGAGQDWFNGACHAPCPTGEYRAQFPSLVTYHAHYWTSTRWGVYVYFGDVHAISAQKQSVNRPYSTVAVEWISTQSGPGCKAPSNPEHPSGCPLGRYVSGYGSDTITPVFYCNVHIRSLTFKGQAIRDWTEFHNEFKNGIESTGDFLVKSISILPDTDQEIINLLVCDYSNERTAVQGSLSYAKHQREAAKLTKFLKANVAGVVVDLTLSKVYCDALERADDDTTPTTTTTTTTTTTPPKVDPPKADPPKADPPKADPPPLQTTATITVEDASGTEGGKVQFTVTLSEASNHKVTVNWVSMTAWHLMDARAHLADYFYGGGTLVFAPGETTKTAEVWLRQDSHDEPDEYFAVEAHFPDRFFESRTQGTMTIIDDD